MRRCTAINWVHSAAVTPDARGEIISALRERDDLPNNFPHCTYFYCLVRDRLKKTDREHKRAAVALYDEYVAFCRKSMNDDEEDDT